jgi:hypothetical protein
LLLLLLLQNYQPVPKQDVLCSVIQGLPLPLADDFYQSLL